MNEISINGATLIVSLVVSNLALIVGFFIGLKVAIVKLETKSDRLERDVNHLWSFVKDFFKNNQEKK